MLSHAPAGLHAGLIQRARPRPQPGPSVVTLLRPPAAPALRPTHPAPDRQLPRHALTVRVEPGLRAALEAEKLRRNSTAQAILHRALREYLER